MEPSKNCIYLVKSKSGLYLTGENGMQPSQCGAFRFTGFGALGRAKGFAEAYSERFTPDDPCRVVRLAAR